MTSTTQLKRAFDKARIASENREIVRGLIGKNSTDSPTDCVVPSRPTFLYVRVANGSTQTITIARNPGNITVRANTPVLMKAKGTNLVIVGVDTSTAYWDVATSGDTLNKYGVAPHTHMIGSGLEYEVETLRLQPGRVFKYSGFEAGVSPFRYWKDTFSGGTIDLSGYTPTSGNHRWVVVGLDTDTNTLDIALGTPVGTGTELVVDDLDSIAFDGIPLGAFKVRYDDTELGTVYDARQWFRNTIPLSDLTDVVLTGLADGEALFSLGDNWENLNLKSASAKYPDQLTATIVKFPFNDVAHDTFASVEVGDGNPASPTYPASWTEETATIYTRFGSPNKFWRLDLDDSYLAFSYYREANLTITGGEPANFIFGPIFIKDSMYTSNPHFKFALFSQDGIAISTDKYSGVDLYNDGTGWSINGFKNDGGGESAGSTVDLPSLSQPFYVWLRFSDDGSQTVDYYVGNAPIKHVMKKVYSTTVSITDWDSTYLKVHGIRDSGTDEQATILIGNIDYVAG